MRDTYSKINSRKSFSPPAHCLKIKTIDMHTGGEPLRVIVDGFPTLSGNTVLERRNTIKVHHDHLRTVLMHEPRGLADKIAIAIKTSIAICPLT